MESLLLLPLIPLIYQDFRHRQVLVWNLVLFGIMQIGICMHKYGITLMGYFTLTNLIVLLIVGILTALYIYLRFRFKQQVIGGGDLIFIALLTPYFSMPCFLYFLILAFLVALISGWIHSCFQKQKSTGIPLVSYVGICYAMVLIYHLFLFP